MWIYKDKEYSKFEEFEDPKVIGFIYMITQISTNKKYIGRKMFMDTRTKTIKGKKKKIKTENDWSDYWSSSDTIKELVKEVGEQDFKKEILTLVYSKGMMTYLEEFALYYVGSLESDEWFNNNIRSKVYRSWVKPEETKELREKLENMKGIL